MNAVIWRPCLMCIIQAVLQKAPSSNHPHSLRELALPWWSADHEVCQACLQDVEKLPDIVSDIRYALDADPGVDKRLPYFCGLAGFDDNACNLLLVVHTSPRATRDFGNFRQNLLFRVQKLVAARGGALTYSTQVSSATFWLSALF